MADGVAAVGALPRAVRGSHRSPTAGAPRLAATAGIHPHTPPSFGDATAGALERLLAEPEVVAVGETGLDYHYDRSPRPQQREAFAWQLARAAALGKPVIVHSREADEDTARLLADAPPGLTGVLHCFSAGRPVLEAALARGLGVSWSGMITFRNWDLAWALEAVPDDGAAGRDRRAVPGAGAAPREAQRAGVRRGDRRAPGGAARRRRRSGWRT